MKKPKIEKVVLSKGGTGEDLEKGVKLLERLTNKKVIKKESKKRIPTLGVSPGLEVGCLVTLRGEGGKKILKQMLEAVDNQIKMKQISENTFSFGIDEYIQIPGMKYQRDIGIIGFEVCVTFARPGKRVKRKKIKRGNIPKKQNVSKKEIKEILEEKFNVEVIGK